MTWPKTVSEQKVLQIALGLICLSGPVEVLLLWSALLRLFELQITAITQSNAAANVTSCHFFAFGFMVAPLLRKSSYCFCFWCYSSISYELLGSTLSTSTSLSCQKAPLAVIMLPCKHYKIVQWDILLIKGKITTQPLLVWKSLKNLAYRNILGNCVLNMLSWINDLFSKY